MQINKSKDETPEKAARDLQQADLSRLLADGVDPKTAATISSYDFLKKKSKRSVAKKPRRKK
jgi:hypothetical protein